MTEKKQLQKEKISEEDLSELADLFRVFGDSTRIRILWSLIDNERSVSEIADIVELTPSAVSHQLRLLKQAKLVKNRREGKTMFYSLDDNHVYMIFDQGLAHILEEQ